MHPDRHELVDARLPQEPDDRGADALADRQDDDKRDGRRESDEDDSAILRRRERVGKRKPGRAPAPDALRTGPNPVESSARSMPTDAGRTIFLGPASAAFKTEKRTIAIQSQGTRRT